MIDVGYWEDFNKDQAAQKLMKVTLVSIGGVFLNISRDVEEAGFLLSFPVPRNSKNLSQRIVRMCRRYLSPFWSCFIEIQKRSPIELVIVRHAQKIIFFFRLFMACWLVYIFNKSGACFEIIWLLRIATYSTLILLSFYLNKVTAFIYQIFGYLTIWKDVQDMIKCEKRNKMEDQNVWPPVKNYCLIKSWPDIPSAKLYKIVSSTSQY